MSILLDLTAPAAPTSAVFMTATLFWGPLSVLFCAFFFGGH